MSGRRLIFLPVLMVLGLAYGQAFAAEKKTAYVQGYDVLAPPGAEVRSRKNEIPIP